MKYIELCAGLGGMGYGLMQAGMECVGYAECDTKCDTCKEYTQHLNYPKKKYYTVCSVCGTPKKQPTHESFKILHDPEDRMWSAYDVRTVSDDDIRLLGRERGTIQGIVAGFPCQAFSIAGKREGFRDAIRGTVFFEIVRFASILRPEFILLENVTGLLSHDQGRTFETIIGTLDELGYVGEWCVLNSASYVPQSRERIFIIGHLRGVSTRKVFPFGRENSKAIEVIGRLEGNHDQNSRVYGIGGVAPTLSTMQGGGQEPKILVAGQLESDRGSTGKIYNPEGIAPTQLSGHGNAVTKVVVPTQFSLEGEGMAYCLDSNYAKGTSEGDIGKGRRTHVIQRMFAGKYSVNDDMTGTLQAARVDKVPMVVTEIKCVNPRKEDGTQTYQHDRVYDPSGIMTALSASETLGRFNIMDGYRIRKLTPLECFRLQSFPDGWYYKLKEHGISDSQLYKMAGNAVTSVVAYEIGKRLIKEEPHDLPPQT